METAMKFEKDLVGEVTVCGISGEINITSVGELRGLFDSLVRSGSKKVVADLAALEYIDSSGLAVMIELHQRLIKGGGVLKLCGLNERINGIFDVTKLNSIFQIRKNRETALAEFNKA
jgi:anti-sigma B factor antagonist